LFYILLFVCGSAFCKEQDDTGAKKIQQMLHKYRLYEQDSLKTEIALSSKLLRKIFPFCFVTSIVAAGATFVGMANGLGKKHEEISDLDEFKVMSATGAVLVGSFILCGITGRKLKNRLAPTEVEDYEHFKEKKEQQWQTIKKYCKDNQLKPSDIDQINNEICSPTQKELLTRLAKGLR